MNTNLKLNSDYLTNPRSKADFKAHDIELKRRHTYSLLSGAFIKGGKILQYMNDVHVVAGQTIIRSLKRDRRYIQLSNDAIVRTS